MCRRDCWPHGQFKRNPFWKGKIIQKGSSRDRRLIIMLYNNVHTKGIIQNLWSLVKQASSLLNMPKVHGPLQRSNQHNISLRTWSNTPSTPWRALPHPLPTPHKLLINLTHQLLACQRQSRAAGSSRASGSCAPLEGAGRLSRCCSCRPGPGRPPGSRKYCRITAHYHTRFLWTQESSNKGRQDTANSLF